jgi:hypothetical protein
MNSYSNTDEERLLIMDMADLLENINHLVVILAKHIDQLACTLEQTPADSPQ